MEIMETGNNVPDGKKLAERYGYPTMGVDATRAIGTNTYDIPDRDLPPVLDPYSASERSKSQIPSCRKGLRIPLRQIIMMI